MLKKNYFFRLKMSWYSNLKIKVDDILYGDVQGPPLPDVLTYYPDVDREIFLHLNFDELQSICHANQYTLKLCHNQDNYFDKSLIYILYINCSKIFIFSI